MTNDYKVQTIALIGLALGKALHEQWAKDARKLYLDAEVAGHTPEECTKISSGVVRDQYGVLRKWRPTKEDSFEYDIDNPTHDKENGMIDILNMSFESLPRAWKGTNLEAGIVAASLVFRTIDSDFTIENIEDLVGLLAPEVHNQWMQRNAWERDSRPDLFLDYDELTPEMQSLDDAHIYEAFRLFENLRNGKRIIEVDNKTLADTEIKVNEIESKIIYPFASSFSKK